MARTKQTARRCFGGYSQEQDQNYQQNQNEDQDQQSQPKDDTNQFVIKFDDQKQCQAKAIQQKYIQCVKCSAILTSQNYIYTNKQYKLLEQQSNKKLKEEGAENMIQEQYINTNQKVWICQFCRYHNLIKKDLKICTLENPCYLIQRSKTEGINKKIDNNQQILIFCIDVSGSMSTYVSKSSRIQSVKQAIIDELKRMKIEKSKKRVGIITFGSQVQILGDGKKNKQILQSGIYNNFQAIVSSSHKYLELFEENISKSYQRLRNIVKQINTRDSTALGPALLCAVEIASTASVGSKVIICTDGQANCGVGSNYDPDFYDKLAIYAKQKRVGVNILSIKGDNCNLKLLGKVALATNGELLKVDTSKLGTQFSKIIADQILGSNAEIFIRLNKRFKFRKVDTKLLSDNGSILKDNYGNFTKQNEITYQFDLIPKSEAKKNKDINLNLYKQSKLPMQIQIKYISQNGNKYLQVFTDWRQITLNQQQIFDDANFNIFASNIIQKLSTLIKQENYQQSRKLIEQYRKICTQKFANIKQNKLKIQKSDERIKILQKVLKSKQIKKKKLNSHSVIKQCDDQQSQEEQQYSGEQDDQEQQEQSQSQESLNDYKRRLRSRSRDKKSQKKTEKAPQKKKQSKTKTKTKPKPKPKQKKQKKVRKQSDEDDIMSSDQQQKVLLKQMRAKTKQIQ